MLPIAYFAKYKAFVATLVIMLAPSGAWGTNYFNWNADSITTSIGPCLTFAGTIDTTEKHSGTASMRLSVVNSDGQMGCHDTGPTTLGPGSDGGWLYHRWWMKISPSFVWGTGQKKMKSNRTKLLNDAPPIPFTMYLHSSSVELGECPNCLQPGHTQGDNSAPQVSYNFDPSTNPAVSNWQEYIIGIKKQTCNSCQDAEFHLWVNGTEIGTGVKNIRICDSTNCNTWVEAWGSNMVSPYPQLQSPTPAGGTIWLDDFSLDNVWNSIFSAPIGSPPQGSSPLAPTGLSVK